MKLKTTVTKEQIINLLTGTVDTIGIFDNIFNVVDTKLYLHRTELCKEYYTSWSSNKNISLTFRNLLEYNDNDMLVVNQQLGNIIRSKFYDKWTKLYDSYNLSYDVLVSNTISDRLDEGINQINTFERKVENEEQQATKIVSENSNKNTDNMYAYNSKYGVPTNTSNSNETTTTSGDADDNTINQNLSENGSEGKSYTSQKIYNRNGRDESGAKLVEKEIIFRNKYLLFNMIFKDIDSIVCSQFY